MKRRDLLRHLEEHGCECLREGGNHTININRTARKVSTIPRHRKINEDLVRKICRDLDVIRPVAFLSCCCGARDRPMVLHNCMSRRPASADSTCRLASREAVSWWPMRAAIALLVMLNQGCTELAEHAIQRAHQQAVEAVRAEFVPLPDRDQLELRTTGNKWGEGLFVHPIGRLGDRRLVWLHVRPGRLYAIGKEDLSLTPRVQLLSQAPEDLQSTAGLSGVSREEILRHVKAPNWQDKQ